MLFDYVASLVLLVFAFRIITVLLMIPMALLVAVAERRQENPAGPVSWLATQILVSLALAVNVAVFTAAYVGMTGASPSWLFAGIGLIATYLVLGSNAVDKQRVFGHSWSPEDQAVVHGAGIGMLISVPAYIVLYIWPHIILSLPGMPDLFIWVFSMAAWMVGFWFVKLILFFIVAGYFINAGFMVLIGGVVAIAAVFEAVHRVLRRSDAV